MWPSYASSVVFEIATRRREQRERGGADEEEKEEKKEEEEKFVRVLYNDRVLLFPGGSSSSCNGIYYNESGPKERREKVEEGEEKEEQKKENEKENWLEWLSYDSFLSLLSPYRISSEEYKQICSSSGSPHPPQDEKDSKKKNF
jgi:ribosomal protein L12E/L44/L45/RPP1/RPP2